MRDDEIIKALRCCADKGCKFCSEHGKPYCKETIASLAWDLIYRQKEEIDRLRETILRGDFTSVTAQRANECWHRENFEKIDGLKAEIERLQDYNEKLRCMNTDLTNNLLYEVEKAKSEERKEFVERLKEYTHDIVLYGEIVTMSRIDNLLAEMESERK